MDHSTETLADRLNQEPVIFRGSTNSELGVILLCAVVFWVPMGLIIGAFMGAIVMGLGLSKTRDHDPLDLAVSDFASIQ